MEPFVTEISRLFSLSSRSPKARNLSLCIGAHPNSANQMRHACVSVYLVGSHSGVPGRVHDSVTACTARPCAHVRVHVRRTPYGERAARRRRGEAWTAAREARFATDTRRHVGSARHACVRLQRCRGDSAGGLNDHMTARGGHAPGRHHRHPHDSTTMSW